MWVSKILGKGESRHNEQNVINKCVKNRVGGRGSTSIWIMSLNLLFVFFYVTPNYSQCLHSILHNTSNLMMLARWKGFIWCLLFMLVTIGQWWLRNRLRSPLCNLAISQIPVFWFFCEIIWELFQSKGWGMIRPIFLVCVLWMSLVCYFNLCKMLPV